MSITKSSTIAVFPILIALNKFKEKGITQFHGINPEQQFLLGLLPEALKLKYSPDQIKSFISENISELNKILADYGFDIRLDETGLNDLGVVTIMDLIGEWLEKAIETSISYDNKSYKAGCLNSGGCIMEVNGKEIIKIITKNGLGVFIDANPGEPLSGVSLFRSAYALSNFSNNVTEVPCDVTIPLVSLDQQPDITFLTGMYSENPRYLVSQALQQNKLEINLDGIHAQSATALGLRKGIVLDRKVVVIDKPFNLWITYGGPEEKYFPLYVAQVGVDAWQTVKDSIRG